MKLKFLSLFLASTVSFTTLTCTAFATNIKSSNSFIEELKSQLENNSLNNYYLNKMDKNNNFFTHSNRKKRSLGNPFDMIIRATQTMKQKK